MAQQLPGNFTFTEFSDEEKTSILLSFTESQLWYLQNFRASSAAANVSMVFEPDAAELQKSIREHAYQLGRIELVGDIFEDVSAARQAAAEAANSTKPS